jgi:hypothetical protein
LIRYLLPGEPAEALWLSISLAFEDVSNSHWAYKYVALAVEGF